MVGAGSELMKLRECGSEESVNATSSADWECVHSAVIWANQHSNTIGDCDNAPLPCKEVKYEVNIRGTLPLAKKYKTVQKQVVASLNEELGGSASTDKQTRMVEEMTSINVCVNHK